MPLVNAQLWGPPRLREAIFFLEEKLKEVEFILMRVSFDTANYSSHGGYNIRQKKFGRRELVNTARSFSKRKCILRKNHCNSCVFTRLISSFSYCSDNMLGKRDLRKETFILAQALRVQFIKAVGSWLREHEAAGHMTQKRGWVGAGAQLSFSSLSFCM